MCMEKETEFQGISIVIQKIADVNLDVLPDWLHERMQNLEFADCIRTFQIRK